MNFIGRILISFSFFALLHVQTLAQDSSRISISELKHIINVLASDSLKGRGNGTPELRMAGDFINDYFLNIGLQPLPGYNGLRIPFFVSNSATIKEPLYNIVGVLPGRSRANEIVMFTSHYDHVGATGIGKDSIFNGANDNASGTTAVMLLAKYFATRNDNERTLVFCTFAGEELGLIGSRDLAERMNPKEIVALINLEMIGIRQYGRNQVFITGSRESELPWILRKQLKKQGIRVIWEDETQHLFERSDNYPFALKGVPAHTIMSSDDHDYCYHRPCDQVKRLDLENMRRIVEGVALSVEGLVDGSLTVKH